MAGFTVENNNGGVGFSDLQELANAILTDMTTNGFTLENPTSLLSTTYSATMNASVTVDPLAATQPWTIRMEADTTTMKLFVATPLQLDNLGNTLTDPERTNHKVGEVSHGVENDFAPEIQSTGPFDFIPAGKVGPATPFSYRMSITDRGFVLVVWQQSDSDVRDYSWICIQRPVNNTSGAVLTTGKAPVFCVFRNMGESEHFIPSHPFSEINWKRPLPGTVASTATVAVLDNEPFRFTVRESDVFRPSLPRSAVQHFPDSAAIMNSNQQISITENNQYVVTYPSGINTARYAYTEELDMIAYTSADVIAQWSDAEITVYGEVPVRKYKAMMNNIAGRDPGIQPIVWGMRLLVLIENGGITP